MAWPLSQDYNEAVQSPASCFADPELKQAEAATNALGLPMPCSGNFADVYEMRGAQKKWAVKCFTREIPGIRERYIEISKYLQQNPLPFMVDFRFLEQGIRIRGQWYPILKMDWVQGFTLNQFVRDNVDKPQMLDMLCQIWVRVAKKLRETDIAHCDLQHGNIMLVPGSKATALGVRLVDYDGMCVPSLELLKSIEVGHPNFQHPQRLRESIYGLEVDRFPHLVIYAALRSLISGGKALWQKYDNGDNLLFKQSDLDNPAASPLIQELRASNDPVLKKITEAIVAALAKPLDQAPLLEDLAPVPPPTVVQPKTVAPVSKPAAPPAMPSAARAVAQPAEEPDDEDVFAASETGPKKKKKGKKQKVSPAVWAAAGIGALFVLFGVILAVSSLGGKKKEELPVVKANVPPEPPDQGKGLLPFPFTKGKDEPKGKEKTQPEPMPEPTPTVDTLPELKCRETARVELPARGGEAVALSPGGRRALIANIEHVVELWDLTVPKKLASFPAHEGRLVGMTISDDGKLGLSSSDRRLRLLDLDSGQVVRTFDAAESSVWRPRFSQDGRRVVVGGTAGGDRAVYVCDVASGQTVQRFTPQIGSVRQGAGGMRTGVLLPNTTQVLSAAADYSMQIWNIDDGKEVRRLQGHTAAIRCLAVSSAGRWAASGSADRSVRVWDLSSAKEQCCLLGHGGNVNCLAMSPDGRLVLSGSTDGLRLWDALKGTQLDASSTHVDGVWDVVFLDNRRAMSMGVDGTVCTWRLDNTPVVEPTPQPKEPTPAEVARFVGVWEGLNTADPSLKEVVVIKREGGKWIITEDFLRDTEMVGQARALEPRFEDGKIIYQSEFVKKPNPGWQASKVTLSVDNDQLTFAWSVGVEAGAHKLKRVATDRLYRTRIVGGAGGEPFENLGEQGATLIGLLAHTRFDGDRTEIGYVEPVYLTLSGRQVGKGIGHKPDNAKNYTIEAKDGYAIGALKVWSKDAGFHLVRGIRVQFMRRKAQALDPEDSYWSEWIGLEGEKQSVLLGGDGTPFIGLYGRAGGAIDSVGAILLSKPQEVRPLATFATLKEAIAAKALAKVSVEKADLTPLQAGENKGEGGSEIASVPDWLTGWSFHKRDRYAGFTSFTVDSDGVVVMVVSPRWKGGGNGTDWKAECKDRDELLKDGWKEAGELPCKPAAWPIFWKQFKKGDQARVRTEKYCAPMVLVPGDSTVREPDPKLEKVFLSDLPEIDPKVGYGRFGKKGSLGFDTRGKTDIVVQGTKSPNGLSMHALFDNVVSVKYKLDGVAQQFHSSVGLCDFAERAIPAGELTFQVLGDGKPLWTSRVVKKRGETEDCTVDVKGVQLLELRVICKGSHDQAMTVWIEPYILRSPPPTFPEKPFAVMQQFELDPKKPTKVVVNKDGFGFLTMVSGTFNNPSHRIELMPGKEAAWYLVGQPDQDIRARATSFITPKRAFFGANVQQIDITPGKDTRLFGQHDGFCYLSGLSGHFAGSGETARVYIDPEGFWHMKGTGVTPAAGKIVCVRAIKPGTFKPKVTEHMWKLDDPPVKMIHKNAGVCFLSGVQGVFSGPESIVEVYVGPEDFWYLRGGPKTRDMRVWAMSIDFTQLDK